MKIIAIPNLFLLIFIAATGSAEDWVTSAERSDYKKTPDYAATMEYIEKVAKASKGRVRIEEFGKTGEGRTLFVVIASRDGVFDPASIHKAGRPVVLIQNGIHAGEIDGKDASLALLRDMVITEKHLGLLDRAVVLFIPVYNVDGHERISKYNRINQNGPEEMGWRTTAINLNLNRDYIKADSIETRSFLKLWNQWLPDFFFDNHVTDGADYQYDITYGIDSGPDVHPRLAQWLQKKLMPDVEKSVSATGHKIGPFINLIDNEDPMKGISLGQNHPRFSTGYSILQNRAGMLVEMHMLKDYKTRVTGNYELLRATLEVINRDARELMEINRSADAATINAAKNGDSVPLYLDPDPKTELFDYATYQYEVTKSDLSGGQWIQYSNEPVVLKVPMQTRMNITYSVRVPAAYVIPVQWTKLIDVLEAHQLKMIIADKPFTAEAEIYRCKTPVWKDKPFEGRHTASFSTVAMQDAGFHDSGFRGPGCKASTEKRTYPKGTVIIPTAQRAAKVAVHFLEPDGPDSAVVWGFLDAIFEQKEYGEGYVLEKMGREMMSADPKLRKEFEQRLATDKAFAASPEARLNFFYLRSPYRDPDLGLYPVTRLHSLPPIYRGDR